MAQGVASRVRDPEDEDATPYELIAASGNSLDTPGVPPRQLFMASNLEAPARAWAVSPYGEKSEEGLWEPAAIAPRAAYSGLYAGFQAAPSVAWWRPPGPGSYAQGSGRTSKRAGFQQPALDDDLEGVSSIVHPDTSLDLAAMPPSRGSRIGTAREATGPLSGDRPSEGRAEKTGSSASNSSVLGNQDSQSSCLHGGISDLELDATVSKKSGASENSERAEGSARIVRVAETVGAVETAETVEAVEAAEDGNFNTLTSSDRSISLFYPLGNSHPAGAPARVEKRAQKLPAQASTLASTLTTQAGSERPRHKGPRQDPARAPWLAQGAARGSRPEQLGETPVNSSTLNRDPARPNTQASVLESSHTGPVEASPAGTGAMPSIITASVLGAALRPSVQQKLAETHAAGAPATTAPPVHPDTEPVPAPGP